MTLFLDSAEKQHGLASRFPRHSPGYWAVVLLLMGATVYFCVNLVQHCLTLFPFDFAVDWTAAKGWQAGLSLYDSARLHLLGQRLIATPEMDGLFQDTFSRYINPP